jgi:hypothetical protein
MHANAILLTSIQCSLGIKKREPQPWLFYYHELASPLRFDIMYLASLKIQPPIFLVFLF